MGKVTAMVEPDPVGVVKDPGSPKGLGELLWSTEIHGTDLNFGTEPVFPYGRIGDGMDCQAFAEEKLGNILPRISKGSGNSVNIMIVHFIAPHP